jgi:predicted ABC-type ATPase
MRAIVTMIAGPNGSGKSTLIAQLRQAGIDFGEYLNADDIARTLTGEPADVALRAQIQVRDRRAAALAENRSHSFETVMSHHSHIAHLRAARAAGFEVIVYFVATDDPTINQGRAANRVLHGGHDVPPDRVVSRYHRSLANLPAAIAVAHGGLIFDNSRAGQPLTPLAEIRDGRIFRQFDLRRPKWWQAVKARLSEPSGKR